MKRRRDRGVEWFEADLPDTTVCFTTRRGGFSEPPRNSLNLGILTGDDRETVLRNRALMVSALGIDGGRIRMGLQVHGSRILEHDDYGQGRFLSPVDEPPEADGHITLKPGLPLLVLGADCLPVAVKGPGGLAMLHCGWRGLSGPLVRDAVARVDGEAAVIGPGIGPCCFEVGDEVRHAFAELGEGIFDCRQCDLPAVARIRLESAGVDRIETAGLCTHCASGDFFSHRRDGGSTGRQAGIAWIR